MTYIMYCPYEWNPSSRCLRKEDYFINYAGNYMAEKEMNVKPPLPAGVHAIAHNDKGRTCQKKTVDAARKRMSGKKANCHL